MEEEKQGYQPTEEEIKMAEESMTDEQKRLSSEREYYTNDVMALAEIRNMGKKNWWDRTVKLEQEIIDILPEKKQQIIEEIQEEMALDEKKAKEKGYIDGGVERMKEDINNLQNVYKRYFDKNFHGRKESFDTLDTVYREDREMREDRTYYGHDKYLSQRRDSAICKTDNNDYALYNATYRKEKKYGTYGDEEEKLDLSGFFIGPNVMKKIATLLSEDGKRTLELLDIKEQTERFVIRYKKIQTKIKELQGALDREMPYYDQSEKIITNLGMGANDLKIFKEEKAEE